MIYLMHEEGRLVGYKSNKADVEKWKNELPEIRSIESVICMDKTFPSMAVEYNKSYEG